MRSDHWTEADKSANRFPASQRRSMIHSTSNWDLDVESMGFLKTKPPFNETSPPGVFAASDCGTMMKAVPQANAMDSFAAAGLAALLSAMDKFWAKSRQRLQQSFVDMPTSAKCFRRYPSLLVILRFILMQSMFKLNKSLSYPLMNLSFEYLSN